MIAAGHAISIDSHLRPSQSTLTSGHINRLSPPRLLGSASCCADWRRAARRRRAFCMRSATAT
eukprot:5607992-Prymnesium_polylepis.1